MIFLFARVRNSSAQKGDSRGGIKLIFKSSYFCGGSALTLALALGLAGTASAQDATVVEEVVVTGSFIAGTPEDAALPVDVIGSKELANRGAPTMVQLIKTIPSSGAVI
ncbi:hypothetical protein, partial [Phenylobacterium sp.]|uniref:hypothetical protein n=1 Tax=Phenylobacterium sp. TaxID=1871053 RepID=UPI00273795A6